MPRKKPTPNRADELLDELLSDCQSPESILSESGLLKQLTKRLVERALAGELNHHLNENDTSNESRNSRNGHSPKTVQSEPGELELAISRDFPKERLRQRQGTFEPVLVPKHQRRLSGLDEKILVLYARGMSTRDISLHSQFLRVVNSMIESNPIE